MAWISAVTCCVNSLRLKWGYDGRLLSIVSLEITSRLSGNQLEDGGNWLHTTQPTSGGALKLLCMLCLNLSPPATVLLFLDKPAMRTPWMAGASPHKSG